SFRTFPGAGAYTIIELGMPANRAGSVSTATLMWSAAPCTAAATIKFFRPEKLPLATTLHYLAERGPFDVSARMQSVALVPPVALLKGDLIAIAKHGTCGDALQGPPVVNPLLISLPHGSLVFSGDVTTDVVQRPGEPELDVIVQASDNAGLPLLGGRFLATLVAANPRTGLIVSGL